MNNPGQSSNEDQLAATDLVTIRCTAAFAYNAALAIHDGPHAGAISKATVKDLRALLMEAHDTGEAERRPSEI